jgi:hypothetical protein
MMALDDFTGGAIRPTATAFRARQRDQSGGIGLNDVAVVWKSYGLPAFTSGSKGWGTIMDRLRAGRPVAMQGWSGALGRFAVGKAVAHAIYATRATPGGMIVIHDPLRNAAITIPEADVQRFYFSGFALAGWGTGAYAGRPATSPTSAPVAFGTEVRTTLAAFLGIPASTVVTSAHIRTAADRIATATGSYGRSFPVILAELTLYRTGHPGITAGDFPIVTTPTGAAPRSDDALGPFDGLAAVFGVALGDAAFTVIVGSAVVALFVLGAWRLTSK